MAALGEGILGLPAVAGDWCGGKRFYNLAGVFSPFHIIEICLVLDL